jgi:hypothetical protein
LNDLRSDASTCPDIDGGQPRQKLAARPFGFVKAPGPPPAETCDHTYGADE